MKKIKRIAEQVVEAENDLRQGKNIKDNMAKIYNIMCSLSYEEMLEVDKYIQQNKMIK